MGFNFDVASKKSQNSGDETYMRGKLSSSYLDSAQELLYVYFRLLTGGGLAQKFVALQRLARVRIARFT